MGAEASCELKSLIMSEFGVSIKWGLVMFSTRYMGSLPFSISFLVIGARFFAKIVRV